jgi:flagellar M-ring protein FliF
MAMRQALPPSNAPTPAPNTHDQPQQTSKNLDQTYVTDESDSDITNPDWVVKSVAVSVVLNKAALGNVKTDQVKAAIASAFAYPKVNVSVLAASFKTPVSTMAFGPLAQSSVPLTHALLEVMAAAFILFGLALPVGRRLATVNIQAFLPPIPPPQPRPMPTVLPPRDFSDLREQAGENIPGVARLLQNWVEENE